MEKKTVFALEMYKMRPKNVTVCCIKQVFRQMCFHLLTYAFTFFPQVKNQLRFQFWRFHCLLPLRYSKLAQKQVDGNPARDAACDSCTALQRKILPKVSRHLSARNR